MRDLHVFPYSMSITSIGLEIAEILAKEESEANIQTIIVDRSLELRGFQCLIRKVYEL